MQIFCSVFQAVYTLSSISYVREFIYETMHNDSVSWGWAKLSGCVKKDEIRKRNRLVMDVRTLIFKLVRMWSDKIWKPPISNNLREREALCKW
jgi:hypothetical protein